jgi:hypothetical protein
MMQNRKQLGIARVISTSIASRFAKIQPYFKYAGDSARPDG